MTWYQYIVLANEDVRINSFNEDVENASKILCDGYSKSRYIPPVDDWPPYHPKHYTPLTIVHHIGRCTESEVVSFAQKFKTPAGSAAEDPNFSNILHNS